MKVPAPPSSHEELELRQVPLTSPRQKNLQAPEDVVRSQVSSVRSFPMLVRVISMLAMQVMVDRVMDLLDMIASEAAPILNFLNWKAGRP